MDVQDGHHPDVQDKHRMNVHDGFHMDVLKCGKLWKSVRCPLYTKWLSSEHSECPAEDIHWIFNGLICAIRAHISFT